VIELAPLSWFWYYRGTLYCCPMEIHLYY